MDSLTFTFTINFCRVVHSVPPLTTINFCRVVPRTSLSTINFCRVEPRTSLSTMKQREVAWSLRDLPLLHRRERRYAVYDSTKVNYESESE